MPNNTVYKLFKYSRCHGNKDKRELVEKIYITEDRKMIKLIEIIKQSKIGKDFTFYIEKYIDDSIRWRKLSRGTFGMTKSGWKEGGDLTTTWEKYVWDNKKKWHASNYRYEDEKVK